MNAITPLEAHRPRTYRGWSISFDNPPIPIRSMDWSATHEDYDAWTDGEGEWTDNGLKVHAETYDELMDAIDAAQDEWAEENGQFGVGS